MNEKYVPKKGERVRATFEGVVDYVDQYGFNLRGQGSELLYAEASIEKLVDPEPKWVNGDVIQFASSSAAAVRVKFQWLWVSSGSPIQAGRVSAYWEEGDVSVLYKVDG